MKIQENLRKSMKINDIHDPGTNIHAPGIKIHRNPMVNPYSKCYTNVWVAEKSARQKNKFRFLNGKAKFYKSATQNFRGGI